MSGLVQEADGSSATTSLTLTLPAATAVNNAMIIAVAGYYGGAISSITLGGTGGLFTKIATSGGYNAEIWFCGNLPVSSYSIVITAGAAGIIAWAYEVNGQVAGYAYNAPSVSPDQSAGNNGSGTSWSSGTTGSTVASQEFIVGLGFTIGPDVTVTGPGTGWTNENSYSDIATADGFVIAGVSGYQAQASSSSTYDYAGTASASTAWAAVAVTFLLMPAQGGWSGYVFQEHSSYAGVSATFTVPSLSGGGIASAWVGLGNVYQTGIFFTYDTSDTGNASCRAWSWWLPGAGENWNAAAYPVKAGDSLTLTIELTSTDWLMTIANSTESWSYTEVKSVLAVNVGSVQNGGAGPSSWPYPLRQAEVIIEREGNPLPDYGSVAFTSVTTTPAIAAGPQPLATVNSGIDQYPGPFSGGAFTMYWNSAS